MGITDTARAKAQSAVSSAQAEVTEISVELKRTQALLDGSGAAGELLDSVADVAVLGQLTGGLRDDLDVDEAHLRAQVDELTAKLSAAHNRLTMAKRARSALLSVVGEGEDDDR